MRAPPLVREQIVAADEPGSAWKRAAFILVPLLSWAVACGEVSEQVTPSANCISGRKWTAGDVGHPEMHPGRNCVGCHIDNDGPPLALGGTVYAVPGQDDDCYGVEGVVVQITAAQSAAMGMGLDMSMTGSGGMGGSSSPPVAEILTLETNAAGNFFLEGDPSIFTKPFKVELLGWEPDGTTPKTMPMATQPETGDCAQCHGATTLPAEGLNLTRAFLTSKIHLGHTLADYGF